MTPPGLVKPEEVPDGWGLLEVHGRRVPKLVIPDNSIFSRTPHSRIIRASRCRYEVPLLRSAIWQASEWVNWHSVFIRDREELKGGPFDTKVRSR